MKASELRKLSNEELKEKVLELKKKLFNLRFQNKIGSLNNTAEIKQTKKDIARILTILKEREFNKTNG